MTADAKPKPLMLDRLRLFLAAIVGVVIGSAVAGVVMAAVEIPSQITHVETADYVRLAATPMQMAGNVAALALMSAFVGASFGGPVFLLIGLPLHGMLLKKGWTNIVVYAALGAVVSALLVSVSMAGMSGPGSLLTPSSWAGLFSMAAYFALAGAIATSIFWLIRRPDRDAALTSAANAAT